MKHKHLAAIVTVAIVTLTACRLREQSFVHGHSVLYQRGGE